MEASIRKVQKTTRETQCSRYYCPYFNHIHLVPVIDWVFVAPPSIHMLKPPCPMKWCLEMGPLGDNEIRSWAWGPQDGISVLRRRRVLSLSLSLCPCAYALRKRPCKGMVRSQSFAAQGKRLHQEPKLEGILDLELLSIQKHEKMNSC